VNHHDRVLEQIRRDAVRAFTVHDGGEADQLRRERDEARRTLASVCAELASAQQELNLLRRRLALYEHPGEET
jgi:hypothetical protein